MLLLHAPQVPSLQPLRGSPTTLSEDDRYLASANPKGDEEDEDDEDEDEDDEEEGEDDEEEGGEEEEEEDDDDEDVGFGAGAAGFGAGAAGPPMPPPREEEEADDHANDESGGEDEKEEGRIMLDVVRSTHSLAPDFVCSTRQAHVRAVPRLTMLPRLTSAHASTRLCA